MPYPLSRIAQDAGLEWPPPPEQLELDLRPRKPREAKVIPLHIRRPREPAAATSLHQIVEGLNLLGAGLPRLVESFATSDLGRLLHLLHTGRSVR